MKENQREGLLLEMLGQTCEQVFIVACDSGRAEGINTQLWKKERFEREEIADMDAWMAQYLESCYVGDDLEAIQRKTHVSAILEVIGTNKPYVMEYSTKEQGVVRRKRLLAGRYDDDANILYLCRQDITCFYEQEQRTEWLLSSYMDMAQNASRIKVQFLQKLDHGIRTPLYGIRGYLEQIDRMTGEGEEIKEYIKKAEECIQEFSKKMADILEGSACENNELIVKNEAIFINDFLAGMQMLFAPYAERKGMSFEICRETPEVTVIASDMKKWEQIFENLLMNAFEYGRAGGSVRLHMAFEAIELDVEEEEELDVELSLNQVVLQNYMQHKAQYMAVLRLENTASGFDAGEIRRVYEEFYTTLSDDRLGMGIPLVRNFVDHMGGNMKLQTTADGVAVEIRIPVRKASRLQQEQALQLTHMLPKIHERDFSYCRALVVDDNIVNNEITTLKLQHMGLKVEQAWNGDEAVEKLLASPINYYQIVFMNPQLPGRTGLSATLEIRKQPRRDISNVVIVALTAHPFRDERIRSLEHGMDYHLPLPLDDIELNEILVRELRGVEQEKEYGILGFRIVK